MDATISGFTGRENCTEDELVMLARQRDAATWSEIYVQNYTRVYSYVYGYLGLKEESEDLAAQVFLEAMQSIESYRDMGRPLIAWLYGIARNLIRARAKSARKAKETLEKQTAELEREPHSQGGISPDMLDLIEGLGSLTSDQRETLVLRFFVGLSAREAGALMGKTENAIYALQVRGLSTLRHLISPRAASGQPGLNWTDAA
jgi:RNA polymerase sigma-70 factor (ECF subfamily)